MDIHIRTKIHSTWSYIERVGVQIGDDILEVKGMDVDNDILEVEEYWINGEWRPALPTKLDSEYALTMEEHKAKGRLFVIDLGLGEEIVIKTYKYLVTASFRNSYGQHLVSSSGLMGDLGTGSKLGRDGSTVFQNSDEFAFEWQVRPQTDPSLFHLEREPQYPQQCIMPSVAKESRRRLGQMSTTLAEEACAQADSSDVNACVYDVLAANDVDLANNYIE